MKDELTCNGFDFLLGLALVLVGVHVKPARTLSICCAWWGKCVSQYSKQNVLLLRRKGARIKNKILAKATARLINKQCGHNLLSSPTYTSVLLHPCVMSSYILLAVLMHTSVLFCPASFCPTSFRLSCCILLSSCILLPCILLSYIL